MRTTRSLRSRNAVCPLFITASLAIGIFVASTPADARIGVNRPGVGAGRVGSGIGFRPGVGVGRAGLGVAGWRNGVGYGYGRYRGYGAAALTGAAIGYAAAGNPYYQSGYLYGNEYADGYGDPYGSGYPYNSGYANGYYALYGYSPTSYYGGGCPGQ